MAAVHDVNVFIDVFLLVMKSRGMDAASAIKFIKTGGHYVSLIEKRSVDDITGNSYSVSLRSTTASSPKLWFHHSTRDFRCVRVCSKP